MTSEHGFAHGDATHYHLQAIRQINLKNETPPIAPKVWSSISVTGNVYLLRLLYEAFGIGSKAYIIINVFLHALAALVLFNIIQLCLRKNKYKPQLSYLLTILFLLSPSHLIWTTQPLKDSFSTLGWFLMAFNFIFCISEKSLIHLKNFLKISALHILGVLLIIFVRPQYTTLTLLNSSAIFVFSILIFKFKLKRILPFAFTLLIALLAYSFSPKFGLPKAELPKIGSSQNQKKEKKERQQRVKWEQEIIQNDKKWSWEKSNFIPAFIDNKFKLVALSRLRLKNYTKESTTTYGENFKPKNSMEFILNFPKAILESIAGPPPTFFFRDFSLIKKASIFIEVFPQWVFLFGFLLNFIFYKHISRRTIVICLFSLPILIIFAWINNNWGTFLRIRYSYLHLINILSLNGFIILKESNLLAKLNNKAIRESS